MKYFERLEGPTFKIYDELNRMIKEEIIDFSRPDAQVCLNTTPDYPDDCYLGNGSLRYEWDKSYYDEKLERIIVPERSITGLREHHFTQLCERFKGTEFERVYNWLDERYELGRVRLMKSEPKTCLSWHVDYSDRVHYPVKTQKGCIMVIEDEVLHMPADTWWMAYTEYEHTAFNGSTEPRIHLVAVILDTK